uniref:hypothetical protein n=1 Tax=Nocardioides sp. TaxID=35761 RepID=UPI00286D7B32
MSRSTPSSTGRCVAVWLLVTAGVLGTCSTVAGAAASLVSSATWHGTFEDLLVAVSAAALVGCAAWLWLVTTATVVDVVRGHVPVVEPRGVARRLVLAACGAVVVAGIGGPALADAGTGGHSLVRLPMPDRAVVTAVA